MMIRPATAEDLPHLQAILAENDLLLDGVAYTDFSGLVLVVVRDNEVTGFIQAIPTQPYAILMECAVDRRYQRRGDGIRLVQAMELALRLVGCRAWVTYSGEKRQDVHDQLERWGARCTGTGNAYVRVLT